MRGILVAHARTSHGDALSELNPEPEGGIQKFVSV